MSRNRRNRLVTRDRLPAARQCYDEAYAKVDTMLGEAALQDGSIDQICG